MAKKRKGRTTGTTLESAPAAKKQGGKGAWKVMDRGSSIVAGLLAQRVAGAAWRVATGKKPPVSGRHPDVSATEAVAWAALGGGLIELVKVGVRRGTATYWVKSTGQLPPGMKPLANGSGRAKEPAQVGPAPSHASTKKISRRNRGR